MARPLVAHRSRHRLFYRFDPFCVIVLECAMYGFEMGLRWIQLSFTIENFRYILITYLEVFKVYSIIFAEKGNNSIDFLWNRVVLKFCVEVVNVLIGNNNLFQRISQVVVKFVTTTYNSMYNSINNLLYSYKITRRYLLIYLIIGVNFMIKCLWVLIEVHLIIKDLVVVALKDNVNNIKINCVKFSGLLKPFMKFTGNYIYGCLWDFLNVMKMSRIKIQSKIVNMLVWYFNFCLENPWMLNPGYVLMNKIWKKLSVVFQNPILNAWILIVVINMFLDCNPRFGHRYLRY